MKFRNPQQAFNDAITSGRLSKTPGAANYAGTYMYMGTANNGLDLFKHIITRAYLSAPTPAAATLAQPRRRFDIYRDGSQPGPEDYDDTNGL